MNKMNNGSARIDLIMGELVETGIGTFAIV